MSTICRDESYAIMGASFEVYKEKGCGFLEAVYQECLEIELDLRNIPFKAHPLLPILYKKRQLRSKYTPDFVCYDLVVVELKAVSHLTDEHRAQVHNYLRATGLKLGLLLNLAHYPLLEYERIVR